MQQATIAGNLGRDAESRVTPSGQKLLTFSVAVNFRRSDKEETVWWRVTVWGDRFDKMAPYLKKGSSVIVTGEIRPPQIYTDKEGKPQISLDITADAIRFSPFGRTDRQSQETTEQPAQAAATPSASDSFAGNSEFAKDDDVPF